MKIPHKKDNCHDYYYSVLIVDDTSKYHFRLGDTFGNTILMCCFIQNEMVYCLSIDKNALTTVGTKFAKWYTYNLLY